jgi:AcrR family transcriptional regulator
MASPRRVGAETSKTRDLLLDCVERLMLAKGYAGVTYRAVAAKADVTPALVQYYFPTLDDLFVAAIRRRSEQNEQRLADTLRAHPDQPLRVLWDYSRDESTAALTTEFLALGNHRPSIRSEIAESTDRCRRRRRRRPRRTRRPLAERAPVPRHRDPQADPAGAGRRRLNRAPRDHRHLRPVPPIDGAIGRPRTRRPRHPTVAQPADVATAENAPLSFRE